jgi:hypothetical protein
MDERSFFSRDYRVRCPVWVVVDLKRFEKGEGANAAGMFVGKPGLGPFLPLFLSMGAAEEFAKQLDLKGFGAFPIQTAADLRKVLLHTGADNVAVYLEKDKRRIDRADDLRDELQSHLTN